MYKQTPVNANGAVFSPLAALPPLPFLVSTPLLISSLDNRPDAACKDLLVTGPGPIPAVPMACGLHLSTSTEAGDWALIDQSQWQNF